MNESVDHPGAGCAAAGRRLGAAGRRSGQGRADFQDLRRHSIGPGATIKVGPPLNGVVGRPWASWPGYSYSQGLQDGKKAGKVWDEATLNTWLENPRALVPNTKMIFPGVKQADQRANVIAYLKQFNASGKKK